MLIVWLAAAAAGLLLARGGDRFQTDVAALVANLEAARADRLVAAHFGGGENETLLYCVRGTAGSATSPAHDAQ